MSMLFYGGVLVLLPEGADGALRSKIPFEWRTLGPGTESQVQFEAMWPIRKMPVLVVEAGR